MLLKGQNYTEIDDIEFDIFPELFFSEGSPIFLDYLVIDGLPTDILNSDFVTLSIEDILVPVGENNFANNHSVAYGLLTIVFSILSGIIAATLFRRL